MRGVIRPVPDNELPLVPPETRYVTVFLVNDRKPVERPEVDRGYVFQTKLSLECAEGFHPRPNLRGARPGDDLDEKIGDLHYRDAFEYAVGHGIAAMGRVQGHGEDIFCEHVSTSWVPSAEVEKVAPCEIDVERRMEELAQVPDGEALWKLISPLVKGYRDWIKEQSEIDPKTPLRRETQAALLQAASIAATRIEDGVWALRDDAQALEAFRIANRVMAAAAWQRSGEQLRKNNSVPTWRPFQLAFLLMNIVGQISPTHPEREAVDLIFFPTGGGKTEAYLGLAAFTLALRRLKNEGLSSAGVTVLMRYTLRLLTLDQLERAATLICALELERRKDPARLGPHRFSIGLWVGKAATPNRFGTDKDKDESTARNRTLAFSKDPKANPSPIPLDKCPWCGGSFSQDTFQLLPNSKTPDRLRVVCTAGKCPFRSTKEAPDGIPLVAVDDEIYRELPCFLIATVDKFAALPWVGKTGLLLGKNVTHHDALGFYGPAGKPPGARPAAQAAAAAGPDHPGRAAPDLGPPGHHGGSLRDGHRPPLHPSHPRGIRRPHQRPGQALRGGRGRGAGRPAACRVRAGWGRHPPQDRGLHGHRPQGSCPDPGPLRSQPRRCVSASGARPQALFLCRDRALLTRPTLASTWASLPPVAARRSC